MKIFPTHTRILAHTHNDRKKKSSEQTKKKPKINIGFVFPLFHRYRSSLNNTAECYGIHTRCLCVHKWIYCTHKSPNLFLAFLPCWNFFFISLRLCIVWHLSLFGYGKALKLSVPWWISAPNNIMNIRNQQARDSVFFSISFAFRFPSRSNFILIARVYCVFTNYSHQLLL